MVFLKPLNDVKFQDVERLKTNKICESQILDYKEALLEDNKLVKQISAFANTQGGFLVFGVKETGQGGYPEKIMGIERNEINTERLEQVILSNTQPRVNVRMKEVELQGSSKSILIIEIPNSHLKPHMNAIDKKFYKRFQNQSVAMTEMEVNDAYKRRFNSYEEIESYLEPLLRETDVEAHYLMGQIIIIPTTLSQMISTSNWLEFEWLKQIEFKPLHPRRYLVAPMTPSPTGVKCQINDDNDTNFNKLEIHRNGCLNYKAYFCSEDNGVRYFNDRFFCIRLLHTLQLSSNVYNKYNYFGYVKIVCQLQPLDNSRVLIRNEGRDSPSQKNKAIISREFSTAVVNLKSSWIASDIMNEVFNSYGEWKCPCFDDEGQFRE